MKINVEELKDWQQDTRRELKREADRLRERGEEIEKYLCVMEATDELLSEINDLKQESNEKDAVIDDLKQESNEKDAVIDDLKQEINAKDAVIEQQQKTLDDRQAEINLLRQQLLDMKEQNGMQTHGGENVPQPLEIHNHFESGSSAQVFNDKVNGRFSKFKRWKNKKKDRKENRKA
jgi:predicted RNase H-like nuclease (RuvC/YqgF family)